MKRAAFGAGPVLVAALAGCSAPLREAASRPIVGAEVAAEAPAPRGGEDLAAPAKGLARVAFLAGEWVDDDQGRGVVVEERWSLPLGGSMLGAGRTIVDDRTAYYEFLVLEERGDEVILLVEAKGDVPNPFRLTTSGPGLAVFAAEADEFPQRIIYRRQGDLLLSRLEGRRDGRAVAAEWSFRRREKP